MQKMISFDHRRCCRWWAWISSWLVALDGCRSCPSRRSSARSSRTAPASGWLSSWRAASPARIATRTRAAAAARRCWLRPRRRCRPSTAPSAACFRLRVWRPWPSAERVRTPARRCSVFCVLGVLLLAVCCLFCDFWQQCRWCWDLIYPFKFVAYS